MTGIKNETALPVNGTAGEIGFTAGVPVLPGDVGVTTACGNVTATEPAGQLSHGRFTTVEEATGAAVCVTATVMPLSLIAFEAADCAAEGPEAEATLATEEDAEDGQTR